MGADAGEQRKRGLVASAVELARKLGVVVEGPVSLRSTNNLVTWLRPSPVVAKISVSHDGASQELAIGRRLSQLGAPVVGPAEGIGHRPYPVDDRYVTFWRYEAQDGVSEPDAASVALALSALHEALDDLGPQAPSQTCDAFITDAVHALDRPGFAPELADHDRRLLRRTLTEGVGALAPTSAPGPIIHGSPHRMNIVVVDGSPRFIDFETVRRGRREWDLAHLEPAVADHYRGALDGDVLERCRRLVSALTATWCWDGLTRGPDMRHHAEHHLETVRSALR